MFLTFLPILGIGAAAVPATPLICICVMALSNGGVVSSVSEWRALSGKGKGP